LFLLFVLGFRFINFLRAQFLLGRFLFRCLYFLWFWLGFHRLFSIILLLQWFLFDLNLNLLFLFSWSLLHIFLRCLNLLSSFFCWSFSFLSTLCWSLCSLLRLSRWLLLNWLLLFNWCNDSFLWGFFLLLLSWSLRLFFLLSFWSFLSLYWWLFCRLRYFLFLRSFR